jgi:hypothetical protein
MLKRSMEEMQELAAKLFEIVSDMPPKELLGYIYSQRALSAMFAMQDAKGAAAWAQRIDSDQFLLEYIHGILASSTVNKDIVFDETKAEAVFEIAEKLRSCAMTFAIASSNATDEGIFGRKTGEIEFRAKSGWVLLRGHRYQVLEQEFYAYVLKPHDKVLREVYGAGSDEIAAGFQAMADASRTGQSDAFEKLSLKFEETRAFADANGLSLEQATETYLQNPEQTQELSLALDDTVRGGVCNVSRHTNLPETLLSDLAFRRGEETDFFADGDLAGTPYRTLPARKKPLIELDGQYYAVDPCFARDAGYRALLHRLRERRPDYRKEMDYKQKVLTENAFDDILKSQLDGAQVFREVYYRDPTTRQWVENDTLILIEDILILVEAKSGAAATVASPELDFARHARSVQDLVVKAYEQCARFFNYLASSDEVPLFKLEGGRHIEIARIRYADYRVALPIGLTVESFSPFSAMCKELPGVQALLGRHPFISMSIDDLFVLKRFLPTLSEVTHYLGVRQAIAGMRDAMLFDEIDHLGAYITRNRFDMTFREQMAQQKGGLVIWDGMSEVVDKHFTGDDWDIRRPPRQAFPEELECLLASLAQTKAPGWLLVDDSIRNFGDDGRANLASTIAKFRETLDVNESRHFHMPGKPGLFVWLQRAGTDPDVERLKSKAAASALAMGEDDVLAVLARTRFGGGYLSAMHVAVSVPKSRTTENSHIYIEAERLKDPSRQLLFGPKPRKKIGRNETCWCGSGTKFKRCHGR